MESSVRCRAVCISTVSGHEPGYVSCQSRSDRALFASSCSSLHLAIVLLVRRHSVRTKSGQKPGHKSWQRRETGACNGTCSPMSASSCISCGTEDTDARLHLTLMRVRYPCLHSVVLSRATKIGRQVLLLGFATYKEHCGRGSASYWRLHTCLHSTWIIIFRAMDGWITGSECSASASDVNDIQSNITWDVASYALVR